MKNTLHGRGKDIQSCSIIFDSTYLTELHCEQTHKTVDLGVQHLPECQSTQAPPEKRCHISLRTLDGFSALCQGMLINLFFPWQMGGEDPLTAGFFILSWLMLMLGLTQLVATMALRATVGASKESTSPPRSEAGGPLLPLLQWEVFPAQLSRRELSCSGSSKHCFQ